MSVDNDKPYVLRVAELIYSKVVNIKKENPELAQTGELTTTQYIIAFAFLLIAFALDEAGVIDLGSDSDSDSD